ncbi:condensation domain-containing protein [Aspergillus pseudotamarii]|uniref:Condensation domain-containing protein n=1 Tax=Aspergillus pseudotamarii TaxID=132259 RepID=A0A5N6SZZ1_ASPPS|nr:condensation domain-containing protein [Aspergillus pseudotamarii]KAE8139331.1 condensation domain-containing protein [Aspergillus pseudotamarii]
MPLGPSSGLYRTGDLVQYQDDGTIRYIGRQGTRMKLHGQLIDLGEVETNTLHGFPAANGVAAETLSLDQAMWADFLGTAKESIGADDNFLAIGGNSIIAMRMVAMARRAGLDFTVADVLSPNSSLSSLALSLLEVRPGQEKPVMSAPAQPSILTLVDFQQHLRSLQQQGILPLAGNVTSARQATEALVSRHPWFNFQFQFQGELNEDRLRDACQALVRAHSVLRVVFTEYREELFQLTLAEDMELPLQVVTTHNQLDSFCESLCHSEQAVSVPSAGVAIRFTLVPNPTHTDQRLIIRLAHAQYDAISIPILVHDLESVYNDENKIADTSIDWYLEQRARHSDQEQQRAFWQEYLTGSSPLASSPLDLSSATQLVTGTCDLALPTRLPPSVTLPTVVKSAASLVLARHLHRPDIVVGQTVDGRSLPFPDVDRVVGACNNHIPFRVQPRASMTVRDYLLHAPAQHARSLGSESVDLRTIVSHCTDWPSPAEFGYIVQHQTANHGLTLTLGSRSASLKLVGGLSPGSEVWICSTETLVNDL